MDTIFALSSGAPPAAIAVVRISGPSAGEALEKLAGKLPQPRFARLTSLRSADGALLDRALVLWFPGPASETGEDCAELQLHGGRAVVDAVCAELATFGNFRLAEPGEFTRRAFANGRMDLLQVEGLADLVSAETEIQRRAALDLAGGGFSHQVEAWSARLLVLSARVEAVLDFDDEDDVAGLDAAFYSDLSELEADLRTALEAPRAETLRDGFRVALAGPPNSGKSTLFNRLLQDSAAIVSPHAGTTRDVLVRPVALDGVPFTLVDMAGLRDAATDEVEAIGIGRAREELTLADCVLWLGPEGEGPVNAWEIDAQIDREDRSRKVAPRIRLSAVSGEGMAELQRALVEIARDAMIKPGRTALARRQRAALTEASEALADGRDAADPLIVGEHLRQARSAFDRLTGRTTTEEMLDTLFGRFCIGK